MIYTGRSSRLEILHMNQAPPREMDFLEVSDPLKSPALALSPQNGEKKRRHKTLLAISLLMMIGEGIKVETQERGWTEKGGRRRNFLSGKFWLQQNESAARAHDIALKNEKQLSLIGLRAEKYPSKTSLDNRLAKVQFDLFWAGRSLARSPPCILTLKKPSREPVPRGYLSKSPLLAWYTSRKSDHAHAYKFDSNRPHYIACDIPIFSLDVCIFWCGRKIHFLFIKSAPTHIKHPSANPCR